MDAETAYIFRHALLRDAVYQLMLPGDRASLHARVVEAADSNATLRMSPREIARHARAAREDVDEQTTSHLRDRESHWLKLAIAEADRRSNLQTGFEMVELLLDLSRGTPAELDLSLQMATLARETGRPERAEGLLRQARVLAMGSPSAEMRVQAQLLAFCIRSNRLSEAERIGQSLIASHRTTGDKDAALQALGHLAVTHFHMGRFSAAEPEYRQARRLAARLGLKSHLARCTANLALLLAETGRESEALAMHREAVRLAEHANDQLVLANTLGNYALLLTTAERTDEAEPLFLRALDLERRIGHRPGYAVALGNLGRLQRMQGRNEEAIQTYLDAAALHNEVGSERHEGIVLAQLADLQGALNMLDQATATIKRAIGLIRRASDTLYEGVLYIARARLFLRLGELQHARADVDLARQHLSAPEHESYRAQCIYPMEAQLAAAELEEAGSLDEAIDRVERASRLIARQAPHELVPVKELLAELRQARDDQRTPHLHYGFLIRGLGDTDRLIAQLQKQSPAAAERLEQKLSDMQLD